MSPSSSRSPFVLGRYVLHDEIAAGGMAAVHLARMLGPVGFSRTVAVKRLHAHLAREPEFVSMFLDEARLAARIQHPNVVATLDVVALDGELFLVMEYVQGESLSALMRVTRASKQHAPLRVVSGIVTGVLQGLHAAHTARGVQGEALDIVHRDVSPQNVLVGLDGVPRLLDFGIAKAIGRLHSTSDGQIKGKTSYMAPEQLRGLHVDARTDVYAAAVVLWEAITAQRLFIGDSPEATMMQVLERKVPRPSTLAPNVPEALDDLVMKGLARDASQRFASARDMAIALEQAVPLATSREIGEWVAALSGDTLRKRAARVQEIESDRASGPCVSTDVEVHALTEASATGMSVATPTHTHRSRAALVGVGALGLVLAVVGAIFFAQSRERHAPVASAPDAASTASTTVAAVSTMAPSPSVFPSASVTSSAAPPKPTSKTTRPPKRNCDPPYTVDANGFRNPKSECF